MNKQLLKKLYSDDPQMLAVLEARDQTDILKTMAQKIAERPSNEVSFLRGQDGLTPQKYVDYFTPEEIDTLAQYIKDTVKDEVTPIKGKDYFDGEPGQDGYTPVKGKDYFDGQDAQPVDEEKIVKTVLKKIPATPTIDEAKLIKTVLAKVPKVEPITVEEVIAEIKKKKLLELRDIKGARLDMNDQRWHGGGLSAVSHDNTLTGAGTPASPLAVASVGSTGAIISATDTGDHQHYTLAQAATTSAYYVIMNNGSYTTDDTAFGFSVSGTTLTFNSALPSDLASTIIKLVCV